MTMNARRAYQILSGDDDVERACASIPDSVCTALPRNYFFNLLNGACGKLAQHIASPGLVIPWLLAALGASPVLVGFVVPVRQAAGLIPQMAAAARIRRYPVRKWFWVGAGTVKAASLVLMIFAALLLPANAAGVVVLVLLAAFATAGGIGSLAFQDVVGKTIPKGRRGRLLAYRGTLGGALTLAAGALVQLSFGDGQSLAPALWMLAGSAALWLVAAAVVLLDQATKQWALHALEPGEQVPLVGDVLSLQLVFNSGAAFSLGDGYTWVLTLVALAVTVGIVVYARRAQATASVWLFGIGLGGAVGNLIDRLRFGHVIDFVDMGIGDTRWYAWNISDAAVFLGIVALFIAALLGDRAIPGRRSP